MEKIKLLCSVMRFYESNFRLLHWNSVGKEFNDVHVSITTKYYEDLGDDIDKVAEIGCMLNVMPLNYDEVIVNIQDNQFNVLKIESNKLYTRKQIVEFTDTMLGDICKLLVDAIQDETIQLPDNTGIKSDLEAMHSKYNLEYKFINKRRMMIVNEE